MRILCTMPASRIANVCCPPAALQTPVPWAVSLQPDSVPHESLPPPAPGPRRYKGREGRCRRINLLGGGTGITPLYQVGGRWSRSLTLFAAWQGMLGDSMPGA